MINPATVATFQAIAGKLLPELLKHKDQILQAASAVVSTTGGEAAAVVDAAHTSGTATAGATQSTFNARGILGGLLGGLAELSGAIPNSPKYATHKGLLDQIVNTLRANHGEISAPQTRDLLTTLDHLANVPVEAHDTAHGNGTGDNARTDGVDDSVPPPEVNHAHANTSGDPFDVLTGSVKQILRRELQNKSSLMGIAAEFAQRAGISIDGNVDKFIDEYLLTPRFQAELKNSILGQPTNTEDFNPVQAKAFKVTGWSLWAIDKLPPFAIQYFPLAATVIKFTMPIWSHISFLRKPLGTLYPVIDEVAQFLGKFQDETKAIKDSITRMRPAPTVETGGSPRQSEAELAGAVL